MNCFLYNLLYVFRQKMEILHFLACSVIALTMVSGQAQGQGDFAEMMGLMSMGGMGGMGAMMGGGGGGGMGGMGGMLRSGFGMDWLLDDPFKASKHLLATFKSFILLFGRHFAYFFITKTNACNFC